jgi:RNA polymerase sigma factor (sigma-70 family)
MDKESFFKEAVEANQDRIFRICCCYALDSEDRRDIYQDTLIHIWNGLRTFREGAPVSSWVCRIAVNTCLDHVRSSARRKRLLGKRISGEAEGGLENLPAREPSPADDRARSLYGAIERLPLADKALISLYLEDLSSADIAGITGLSEGHVRVRIHRIKNGLKSIMNEVNHGTR